MDETQSKVRDTAARGSTSGVLLDATYLISSPSGDVLLPSDDFLSVTPGHGNNREKKPAEKALKNVKSLENMSLASAVDTSIELVAEKCTICSTKGLLKATVLWLALYYILNCSYPSSHKNTLTFLQKTILGFKDTIKTPMAVAALTIKLNDLINNFTSTI